MQTNSIDTDRERPQACRLTGAEFNNAKQEAARLLEQADTIEERPEGYGFRFADTDRFAEPVLRFINLEREYCPFLTLELGFEPQGGGLWLRFGGSDEIKEFARDDLEEMGLGDRLRDAIPVREQRNTQVVRRPTDEVMNDRKLEVIPELFAPAIAPEAESWIAPFLESFPDAKMFVVELIAAGETVAARFTCSGTHQGTWLENEPTGRRFDEVDEVSIFHFSDGKIADAWGIEDTLDRLEQLGLR